MADVDVNWTTIDDKNHIMTIINHNIEPGKYEFMMDNKDILEIETLDGTFKTTKKYTKVHIKEKKIKDFHFIDKQKIFAVAYSALQQVDKIQQAEKAKLEEQTSKLEEQTSKLEEQTSKLEEQTSKLEEHITKLAAAEAEIATLKTTLTDVLARLAALEN